MSKLSEVNKYIIAVAVTLVVGISIGFGGTYAYFKYNPFIEEKVKVITLEGKKGVIEHKDIKTKGKNIEITTESKGKGKIKTIIPKSLICPKPLKNSISLNVYAGLYDLTPTISYGIQYTRQIFTRIDINVGFKIDTIPYPIYQANGFQTYIGVGFNF